MSEGACYLPLELGDALVASVSTGQRSATGEVLWEGEFPVDPVETWSRVFAAQWRRFAARQPAARSVWTIYIRTEPTELAFLKSSCGADDVRGDFFAHVRPADVAAGDYVDVPIGFSISTWTFAAMFDEKCLMTTMKFPPWTVGAAWVGEHAPDTGALRWQTKFQVGGDEG